MVLDGLLIPARYLVNGSTIVRDHVERADYVHVELHGHDVLLAEGTRVRGAVSGRTRRDRVLRAARRERIRLKAICARPRTKAGKLTHAAQDDGRTRPTIVQCSGRHCQRLRLPTPQRLELAKGRVDARRRLFPFRRTAQDLTRKGYHSNQLNRIARSRASVDAAFKGQPKKAAGVQMAERMRLDGAGTGVEEWERFRFLDGLSRAAGWLERGGMIVAGVCFVAIVLITAVDVTMRYALNAPLIWAFELISDYLMVAIFFLAIATTQRVGQNIGVDIVARRLPGRVRAGLTAVCQALTIGLFAAITITNWPELTDAYFGGDVLAGAIPWPRWPTLALLVAGCAMLLLRLALQFVGNFLAACFGALHLASYEQHAAGVGVE
jgi:TRAP-type C4-dicarboxylate transport system permease small subunit